MVSKAALHAELDALIPRDARTRSHLRMIGHCLIELGYLTAIECTYEHCIMDTRKFKAYEPVGEKVGLKYQQNRMHPTVDHIIELRLPEGTDLPDNLTLVHLGCNTSKARKLGQTNPTIRDADRLRGFATSWARDPEKMMAEVWSDEARAKRAASMKRYHERRRAEKAKENL